MCAWLTEVEREAAKRRGGCGRGCVSMKSSPWSDSRGTLERRLYTSGRGAGLLYPPALITLASIHGILQARILEGGSLSLPQGIFSTQGSNRCLPYCRQILYQLSHEGSPSEVGQRERQIFTKQI